MKARFAIYALLLAFSLVAYASDVNKDFQLLPLPQHMELHKENSLSVSEITHIRMSGDTEYPVMPELLSRLPRYKKEGIGVVLALSEKDVPESGEGYVMDINSKEIKLTARSAAGLFYGCQTLEQLLEDSREKNIPIPCLKIIDYPKIAFRAVHLDTKHHLDRTEYYYRLIDKLARYKINNVIWEVEDKLRFTRRPEVGAPNAISKQEMQAICRYAKERHITINPLIQGLGHAGHILKHHWELRENPHSDWEFCPSNPRTYEILCDLYLDAMEAMPYSKYLHIGGDEITAIGLDERCKATGKTAFELQMDWLKTVCDFVTKHGKTPIFWDDMPLKYADLWWLLHRELTDDEILQNWKTSKLDEAVRLFPKNCVYMRWHYEDPTKLSHRMLLEWYHAHGFPVMGATAAATGDTPFMPRNNSRAQYIKDFCQLVSKNSLDGIIATSWDDGSPHLETVLRGFIAQGEFGWNPGGRSVDEFLTAHAIREWGLGREQVSFLSEMEQAAFFFDKALVTSGARNPAWGVTDSFELVQLPDTLKPGTWSVAYKGKIDTAHLEQKRYELICEGLSIAKSHALRNRYALEIYEQTNELFHYPVRLLLALEAYDLSFQEGKGQQTAREKLEAVCRDFGNVRRKLESVYSRTRFMQNPQGYLSDQNHHHHLAALSNGSEWWYLYELPMTEKVKDWLKK